MCFNCYCTDIKIVAFFCSLLVVTKNVPRKRQSQYQVRLQSSILFPFFGFFAFVSLYNVEPSNRFFAFVSLYNVEPSICFFAFVSLYNVEPSIRFFAFVTLYNVESSIRFFAFLSLYNVEPSFFYSTKVLLVEMRASMKNFVR
jgi:hypothetical protein